MARATVLLRRIANAAVPLAVAVSLATCGIDRLTGTSSVADIALSTDTTVIVGATKRLSATMDGGTPLVDVRITWTSSSAAVATVDDSGGVTGVVEGVAVITASITAPELPPAGVTLSRTMVVGFGGLVVAPIDSLTGLGETVTPTVRGTNAANAPITAVTATLTSSDSTVVAAVGATIVAKRNGTATISAAYAGLTVTTTVRVRQVAGSITFAATPFVFRSLGRDTSVVTTVRDTRDSVMTALATWSSLNAAVATVTSVGVMRALQVAPTSLRATVDTVTATLPVSVTQTVASLTKLAGDGQTQIAGIAALVAPSVTVRDFGGFAISGATVAFGVVSGGGSLAGATPLTNASGNATLGAWTLGTTAGANSLTATAGGVSQTFTATGVAGPAVNLVFAQAPSAATANAVAAPLTPAIQVNVTDVNANLVASATAVVTVALGVNPGSATLGGTTVVSAVSGVAAFGALTISAPSAGYTLVASSAGLTSATTSTFTVLGPPAQLAFAVQPLSATSGSLMPSVQVVVQDAAGTTLPTATNSVALALGLNPGGATLTGGGAVPAIGGVAAFGGVRLNRVGTGYTLTSASAGLTGATSTAFNVTPGAADGVVFLVSPSAVESGVAITPAVQVAVADADGNTVTAASGTMTATIATGTGGTLTNATATITDGVATFAALTLTGTPGAFTLRFSDGTRTVTSSVVTLSAAGVAVAIVTAPPAVATNGVALATQPVVRVIDGGGNTVQGAGGIMTATIASGTGGSLVNATATITAGVATFTSLRLNGTAGAFTLQFSDGTRTVTTGVITLGVGAASALAFTTPPPTVATNGVDLTEQPVVTVVDVGGNTVTSDFGTMTATIASGTSGSLIDAIVPITAGVATFAGLRLNGIAGLFTLQFSDGARTVTSSPIGLVPGAATGLALVWNVAGDPPSSGQVITYQPSLTVIDAGGNRIFNSGTMTATIASGTGGSLTNATATITAGVATFSGLTLTGTVGSFALQFSDGTRVVTSEAFTLRAGPGFALQFSVPPSSSTTNGVPLSPQPVINILDASGNTVVGNLGCRIIAYIASGTGGSLVNATATEAGGAWTFGALTLNGQVGSFTVGFDHNCPPPYGPPATNPTLVSSPITLDVGAATTVVLTTAPSASATNGVALTTQPEIRVTDAGGNTITSASGTMTATIASGTGGSLTNATATITAGVATFSGLTLSGTAGPFTLQFSDGTRTVTSSTITLSP